MTAEVVYQVDDFATALSTAFSMIGGVVATSGPGGTTYENVPPTAYDRVPNLFAKDWKIDLKGPASTGGEWKYVLLTITYGIYEGGQNPEGEDGPTDLGEFSMDFAVEQMTLKGQLKWASGTPKEGQALADDGVEPQKQVYSAPITVQKLRQVTVPGSLIAQNLGKLNDQPFESPLGTFPVGSVLFCGASTVRKVTTAGDQDTYNITYKYLVADHDLRKQYDVDNEGYYNIDKPIYQTSDIMAVLRYPEA